MKRISIILRIESLSNGKYLVQGNIDKEESNGTVIYRSGDKVFDKDESQEKNRKDALKFVKEHQAEFLEILD